MVVAQAAGAASIRLYRDRDFRGPSDVYNYADNNLAGSGQNNRVSSARILSGVWELCTGRNYSGHCETFDRDVANLGAYGINNNVSSIRPVSGRGGWGYGGIGNRGITLFVDRNYSGMRRNFTGAENNLRRTGLNNRVSSIRVLSGRWLLCTGANYTGDCLTFSRNVPNLGAYGINNQVSSLRPVTGNAWGGNWWTNNPWPGTWFGFAFSNRRPGRGDLVIFEDAGYRGRWAVVTRNMPNLRRTGLNDRISSLSVRDGVWKLCARPNYLGRCIFVSDDVYNLAGIFNDRVSSIQRVR